MNLLLFLIILILLIVILTKLNSKNTSTDNLKKSIDQLNEKIKELNGRITISQKGEEKVPVPEKKETIIPPPVIEKPVEQTVDIPVEPLKEVVKEFAEQTAAPKPLQTAPQKITKAVSGPSNQNRETWFAKWLRNNPDMEKFIGENLINKIGIAVLILGIAFFVKYAIDQDWINEVGRVSIGLLCGIILIFVSYRLRKNYRSFSSVLVGGGLTVFYFTIAFAFHQYDLISQSAAFIIMIVITAFAVILSILYDRIELGILATIGGFITPFLVSTGQGNYVVLFTYLCILNGGLIVLAFYKRWHALHFIAFAFTAFIYGAWIAGNTVKTSFPYAGTFLFGTIFYLMFVAMSIMLYARKSIKMSALDVALLIAVNLGYYTSGIFLLQQWGFAPYKGFFTASLGVLNLLLALFFYKRKNIDKNFIYLLIGVTLTFISLTAPVQLEGNYITIFWAAEMVILFWLYQRSFISLLKIASALITILTLLSLFMDWSQVYVLHQGLLPVIINKGFTTTIFCAAAMSAMVYVLKKEADTFYLTGITNSAARIFYIICSVFLFFMGGLLEINYQFSHRYTGAGLQFPYVQMFIIGYFLLLLWLLPSLKIRVNNYLRIGIPLILALYYLINIQNNYRTEKFLLESGNFKMHYIAYWIGIIFMGILISQTIFYVKHHHEKLKNILTLFTWIAAIVIVAFFSVEIKNLYVWLTYQDKSSILYSENLYSKAGLSIVWGLSSFAFIWLGLHYGYKTLRIVALVLFGITLLKLFAFDIRNIAPGGKIIAFILLGVLLLTVSFMYQRLKKLIIDADKKE